MVCIRTLKLYIFVFENISVYFASIFCTLTLDLCTLKVYSLCFASIILVCLTYIVVLLKFRYCILIYCSTLNGGFLYFEG